MLSDRSYKPLDRSLKGKYPFRLGTTSFIYPDGYAENIRMLAPFFDEIELLFLDSLYDGSLPDEDEIEGLFKLKEDFQITYNVHLPIDISVADHDPFRQRQAVYVMKNIIGLTGALSPGSFTLHLPYGNGEHGPEALKRWVDTASSGIDKVLSCGVSPRKISVENLMYPYEWLCPVVERFDLSVTMDVGHLILKNRDISGMADLFSDRISMVHLHGVDRSCKNPRDHVSITYLEDSEINVLRQFFSSYREGVSIEVFSYDKLSSSVGCFAGCFPEK